MSYSLPTLNWFMGKYKHGLLSGKGIEYFLKGDIKYIYTDFVDGKKHGKRITFQRDGEIKVENYIHGEKIQVA